MRKHVLNIQEYGASESDSQSQARRSKALKIVNIVLSVVIVLLIIAIILFTTTLTLIGVKGESMMPNLIEGDKLVLLKWGYSLDYGDIVVFRKDKENEEGEEVIVKRVVAKGGDVISFDTSTMKWIRNGEEVEESYFKGEYNNDYFTSILPELTADGITVEEGHIFVLGDNRSIPKGWSNDSHIYGAIPQDTVMGKVIKVISNG
ncbi:MAG: signal peptidase I [Clostridia bacterium]|nr:signal peptidase I [Clostridia bacterium]MDE7328887.1 signal peptidase I [Clostridia bacterium]